MAISYLTANFIREKLANPRKFIHEKFILIYPCPLKLTCYIYGSFVPMVTVLLEYIVIHMYLAIIFHTAMLMLGAYSYLYA